MNVAALAGDHKQRYPIKVVFVGMFATAIALRERQVLQQGGILGQQPGDVLERSRLCRTFQSQIRMAVVEAVLEGRERALRLSQLLLERRKARFGSDLVLHSFI